MKQDELIAFLKEITAVPGTSGYEQPVAEALCRAFAPYCDSVQMDGVGSVVARQAGKGPKVMLCAHLDEISMMTLDVEEDGSVRFLPVGMADMILPAQEVTILTKDGPLYGVIGSTPPHLSDDRSKGVTAEKLFIDTGLSPEEVRRRVPAGTPVQLTGETIKLEGGHVASKTLDDRACVAILLACAQEMQKRAHDADIYYVLSAQEEVTSLGALTSAYAIAPDMAFVLDVTHGTMEGCKTGETFPLDASTLAIGPNLHPGLTARLREEAERLNMKIEDEVVGGHTGTDAWEIQTAREGIPCALLSLPIKYMHTSVELASAKLMLEQAHLLAQTLAGIETGWEETLCC